MFRNKKAAVFTATYCGRMEQLRQAIEVWTGQRTIFRDIDFNTNRTNLVIGGFQKEVKMIFHHDDMIEFRLIEGTGDWHVACFDKPGIVQVINRINPHSLETVAGLIPMWWVGRSNVDRWMEPLYPEQTEYSASVHGMSLKTFLYGSE